MHLRRWNQLSGCHLSLIDYPISWGSDQGPGDGRDESLVYPYTDDLAISNCEEEGKPNRERCQEYFGGRVVFAYVFRWEPR